MNDGITRNEQDATVSEALAEAEKSRILPGKESQLEFREMGSK